MASIRFIKNINLEVEFDGKKNLIPFSAGSIFTVKKIEVDTKGYNDIFMPDGSILRGIDSSVFENMANKVPVSAKPVIKEPEPEPEVEEPVVVKPKKPKSKKNEPDTTETE